MAQATTSLPLNSDFTFQHISVHMVHVLARMAAKKAVQAQLRDEGVRLSQVPPREISELATTYLRNHSEVWREALAKAHLIDEAEGRRKTRQKLRRQQLARLVRKLPVYESDHAKTPIEKTQEIPQPKGD